uniref:Uncharacterized protein n=1 Tax=Arundo donax TaxID=35708 RepID=A0A0A9AUY8_ARUDO
MVVNNWKICWQLAQIREIFIYSCSF